jgi:hypothetical protein
MNERAEDIRLALMFLFGETGDEEDDEGGVWISTAGGARALVPTSDLVAALDYPDGLIVLGATVATAARSALLALVAEPRAVGRLFNKVFEAVHDVPDALIGSLGPDGIRRGLVDLPIDEGQGVSSTLRVRFRELNNGQSESGLHGLSEQPRIGGVVPLRVVPSGHAITPESSLHQEKGSD